MRLTILALFIALPVLAYGAVSPQPRAPESNAECGKVAAYCDKNADCCPNLKCGLYVKSSRTKKGAPNGVCFVSPFALIYVEKLSFM